MFDESAYLELKGLIIDWAEEDPKLMPSEVVEMLKRFISEVEGIKEYVTKEIDEYERNKTKKED